MLLIKIMNSELTIYLLIISKNDLESVSLAHFTFQPLENVLLVLFIDHGENSELCTILK